MTITLVAAAALAGCNKEENSALAENVQTENTAATVELPPAITASKTYRCKDNSLVYIDWLEKNGQPAGANFRSDRTGTPTSLKPGADGAAPFTAEGYSLSGDKAASTVELTGPGKGAQSCKA